MAAPGTDPAPIHGTADSNTLAAPSFSPALLAPFIPSRLAGAGLTAFSANLMTMYFRNQDMHDKAFRPTQDGQQLANNIVMLGAGLALLFSGKKK
ncbi:MULTISPECIES: hypothetical protein [Rothia]|uniref:hypothetical protein n=1 Tax=Rothia TaxID=32207 RepID=UPI001EE7ACB6|nr:MULTISPECIES: hypothetical protein [Rothia]